MGNPLIDDLVLDSPSGFSPQRRKVLRQGLEVIVGSQLMCGLANAQQSVTSALHNPLVSPSSGIYKEIISSWDNQEQIWPYLTTLDARSRFVRFILKEDRISEQQYFYDEQDREYQKKHPTIAINVQFPFVCRHFSRKMYYTYRVKDDRLSWVPQHQQYRIQRAPLKLRIPIREVEISFPQELGRGRPHAINAVYLGGSVDSAAHWYFFDPQYDAPLFRSFNYLWKERGNIFTIYPDHNLALDRETERPIDPHSSQALRFQIALDWKVVRI